MRVEPFHPVSGHAGLTVRLCVDILQTTAKLQRVEPFHQSWGKNPDIGLTPSKVEVFGPDMALSAGPKQPDICHDPPPFRAQSSVA